MEKANSRMKALKRQIDQNYDEMSAVNAAKRKLQRDLETQVEQLKDLNQQEQETSSNSTRSSSSPLEAVLEDPEDME